MEEYARFVLDDAAISSVAKQMRHDFVAAIPDSIARSLVHGRDTQTDIGREVRTEAEYRRTSTSDVAAAAAGRLSEALRSIEEYGKMIDAGFAQLIEQLRYRSYELDQRIQLTTRARERFGAMRLYVIIAEALCVNDWFATAEAALDGGADCLQLREKNLPDAELFRRATRLVELCRDRKKLFIMNDRPDVAMLSHAHGVHVGQDDLPVSSVRRLVPPDMIIGCSTHTVDQIGAAAVQAPDYVAVGPMFDTATKPQDHIAGVETLTAARSITSLPLVAIGGINSQNAPKVLSASSCCLCVCSAVIGQREAARATAELRAAIDRHDSSIS